MKRQLISDGAPWENVVGYSRAVRTGCLIEVSGTSATVDGQVQCEGDAGEQTRIVLSKIKHALEQAGASLHHVVRTRIYVTDISRWEEVGRMHATFFDTIKPATTMVEVNKLIDARMLVEIEATAWIED